jgi:transglutaminase-like putative cysteine protease
MKFSITHSTTYTYALPVQLAPHVVRLRPRCDGALWLLHFDICIEPQASALSQCLDLEGNTVTHAWFDGKTERLSVTSRSEVETLRTNAFDYLLDPSAWRLPPRYPGVLETLLAPYCLRAESDDIGKFAQPERGEHFRLLPRISKEAAGRPPARNRVLQTDSL